MLDKAYSSVENTGNFLFYLKIFHNLSLNNEEKK